MSDEPAPDSAPTSSENPAPVDPATGVSSAPSSSPKSNPALTPTTPTTPCATPQRCGAGGAATGLAETSAMDGGGKHEEKMAPVEEEAAVPGPAAGGSTAEAVGDKGKAKAKGRKGCVGKRCSKEDERRKRGKGRKKRERFEESSSDESSASGGESEQEDEDKSTEEEDESDDESGDESSSDSEEERRQREKRRRRKRREAAEAKRKKRSKTKTKTKRRVSESSSSESDDAESSSSESESEVEEKKRRKQKKRSSKKRQAEVQDDEEGGEDTDTAANETQAQMDEKIRMMAAQMNLRAQRRQAALGGSRIGGRGLDANPLVEDEGEGELAKKAKSKTKAKRKRKTSVAEKVKKGRNASTLDYKRVDQLWDSTIHNFKLTESVEHKEDDFSKYLFTVRRKFDWENKYRNTVVDIKSKLLREALQEVMKDVKGVSLVEDQPCVDPNMLFLYCEELREYVKKTLKSKAKTEKKSKARNRFKTMMAHCKVLLQYLDQDYDKTKKTLYPMLQAGNITFDLLWALFKPNALAYTPTYGTADEPRAFKIDYALKDQSLMRGEYYVIEGRYLEYDGKSFGLGDFEVQIDTFKGARKITSLPTYPIQNHKDPEGLKKQLVERGKQFVALSGMNYRFHKGMAFMKKKKSVLKVNVNGRVMVDPAIFRRINPNYPISTIKPKESDFLSDEEDEEEDSECGCGHGSDSEGGEGGGIDTAGAADPSEGKTRYKIIMDKNKVPRVVEVPVDEDGQEIRPENIDTLPGSEDGPASDESKDTSPREFTEEELLIASPVVLGFAFSEKLWLEFTVSGLQDIEWNDDAFQSLVLPANQKSIVKALVESHKFHASKTIDDVVQGKGRGLCAVLHGPPGTGKTLTAEGIAELLQCPLYMVTAGELGTDPRILEHELQKILDIAHSWGAVLLLDEADVFLEKREVHDIHRNALVSIFLRLLEYFQGILFLTTNRVETFDDAFQSRIHVALRYGELTIKAKKAVWKMFLERVRAMEDQPTATNSSPALPSAATPDKSEASSTTAKNAVRVAPFTDADYDRLSRNNLNGRQIKNAVRTAQALAVNEDAVLGMDHIRRVLEVAESFEKDLKGGTGFDDAMRSYT